MKRSSEFLRDAGRKALGVVLMTALFLGVGCASLNSGPQRMAGDFDMAIGPQKDAAGQWAPSGFDKGDPNLPTLFIAGDSTATTGNPTHRGWGAVLTDYFDMSKINIVNRAVGGRSFRTFYGEGAWQQIVDHLKPGDCVIIEFGHNDGGSPSQPGGRGDVEGTGDDTVEVARPNGTTETVHSYGWYTRKFIQDTKSKGAFPIVSTTTVRNMWSQDDKVERGMGHMLDWAKQVAEQEKVPFVDHSNATADVYETLGFDAVQKFHPADHTHTSTDGAIVNAETLIAALRGMKKLPLNQYLNEKGRSIKAEPPKDSWVTYAPPPPLKGN